jgi:hyaluronan synthase
MIWSSVYYVFMTKGGILIGMLSMSLLWAAIPALVNLQHRSTKVICRCYIYGLFYALTLFWLVPYAVITVSDSRWLTRKKTPSSGKC